MLGNGQSVSRRRWGVALLAAGLFTMVSVDEAEAACRGAWREGVNYAAGDTVTYNGLVYTARVAHGCNGCGWNPVAAASLWLQGGTCSGGPGPTPTPTPTPPPPPPPGGGFSSIVSQAQFNQMFPNRNQFYTYQGLVSAASRFPSFAGTGTTAARRREAAAAMANFSHETGGLVHITEIAQGLYCSGSSTPCGVCAAGKRYFGRGPIQLSWNFNYCTAGRALGLNLWADPDLVARNASVAWSTALWYWMTQSGPGSQPAHGCMVNNAGFGCTIRSINGSLECNGGNPAQVQSRIRNYTTFKGILGAGASVGPDGC
jgi:hypothetical protein